MAVVGLMAPAVSEYFGRNFDNLAGSPDVSGTGQGYRDCRRGMVGIVSIGNALGRVFWAWVSDWITRRATFAVMYLLQAALFWFLPMFHSVTSLTVITFIVLMCYGGGFGIMPAFAADYFGAKNVGPIYGLMLTAWGFASAFGPLLIAHMRQSTGAYQTGLHVISIIMVASIVVPLLVRPPKPAAESSTAASEVAARTPRYNRPGNAA